MDLSHRVWKERKPNSEVDQYRLPEEIKEEIHRGRINLHLSNRDTKHFSQLGWGRLCYLNSNDHLTRRFDGALLAEHSNLYRDLRRMLTLLCSR